MRMCYAGSSGMMATSGPTPNGQQNCSPVCPCDYRELARRMYLSWQWPKAVNKLGILDIPCLPAPDHLRVYMFKVDDLMHLRLSPNHYLCIQYAWALQFKHCNHHQCCYVYTCRLPDCIYHIHEPILYHHGEYVVKLCPHPTLPEALPGVHTSSTSYTIF